MPGQDTSAHELAAQEQALRELDAIARPGGDAELPVERLDEQAQYGETEFASSAEDKLAAARRQRFVNTDTGEEAHVVEARLLSTDAAERDEGAFVVTDENVDAVEAATPDDEPIAAGDAAAELLIRNGYNVVKSALLDGLSSVRSVPLEAIDATIGYTEQAIRRLRALGADPQARQALAVAEFELGNLRVARTTRKALVDVEERANARSRLAV